MVILYTCILHKHISIMHGCIVTDINDCVRNQCHKGECVDQVNGYECDCKEGWEGEHCQIGEYNR